MMSVRLISSPTSFVQLVGDEAERLATSAPYSVASRAAPSAAELGRIGHVGEHLHHADQVPTMPKAGAQSPIAR